MKKYSSTRLWPTFWNFFSKIKGLDGGSEKEEDHYEGQKAVTIEVEDIEKSLTILDSEEERVRTEEGLVKAVPAKVVEVGRRVGVLYEGQIYENLAPDSQYYEQVRDLEQT